ncbi:hypothetical protein NCC49_002059 [Naganishia albida]|nr:hypothetical protein NCC49_002059 [Naganishia albida]
MPYWPFPSFPLSPFSRSSTSPPPSSFPFDSPPGLTNAATPLDDGSSRGPLTPAQAVELEDRDLYFVDRALMDFAAAGEEGWELRETDVRVKQLWVHPIKSCRGVSLQKSIITPQGLQYDRQWAIRETETSQMCTAREYPSMVLITPEIDQERNLLVVRFPEGTELPGFAVKLNVDGDEIRPWTKVGPTIMHKKPLPPSYIPTYIAIPGSQGPIPSPAEQLSTYLGRAVEFIQKSPFEEDVRKLVAPPTISTRGKGWLQAEDVEYGVERAETGYADGYPVLIANETSFRDVRSSLADSVNPVADSKFANLGPTFNKAVWEQKELDIRRFRANVIVGPGQGEKGLNAWYEETWRDVEFWGRKEVDVQGEDVEMVSVNEKASGWVKRGGMICVSRCGRCQLPNVDPDNGEADKAVPYKILAKYRRVDPAQKFTPIFGVNAVPQQARAVVCVGDRVRVRGTNEWEVLGRS